MNINHSSATQSCRIVLAASNKVVKYAGLSSQGEFVPIAVESHDPINRDALQFLSVLGSWRLVETTGDVRASSFFSNGFPLWCNNLILFCCTMVLLMMTGQCRVHYPIIYITLCNF